MATLLSAAVATVRLIGWAIAAVHRATVVRYLNGRRRGNGRPELSPGQRRLTAVVTGAVVVLTVIVVSSGGAASAPLSVSNATAADRTPSSSTNEHGVPASPTDSSTTNSGSEAVTVARIVDGDTITLRSGEDVRVLGIDSCEANTPGGRDASAKAQKLLFGAQITLTSQPHVDRDRSGRLLRYVAFNGQDFGEFMVRFDHTGVYQGANDASPDYVAKLYASDLMYGTSPSAGRICGEDPPPAPSADPPSYDQPNYDPPSNNDDSNYAARKAKGYVCRKTIFC